MDRECHKLYHSWWINQQNWLNQFGSRFGLDLTLLYEIYRHGNSEMLLKPRHPAKDFDNIIEIERTSDPEMKQISLWGIYTSALVLGVLRIPYTYESLFSNLIHDLLTVMLFVAPGNFPRCIRAVRCHSSKYSNSI